MRTLDLHDLELEGLTLIEASAGTGKTFTIVGLVERLVLEAKLALPEILVVTYTRAATAELRARIRDRLREGAGNSSLPEAEHKALKAALEEADQASICTIHGFCQRVLAEFAFLSGESFDLEMLAEEGPLIQEIVLDWWGRRVHSAPAFLVSQLIDKKAMLPSRLVALARQVLAAPEAQLLPTGLARVQEAELEELETRWRESCDQALAVWRRDPDGVRLALCSDALNRNKYRIKTIEEVWVPAMEGALMGAPGAWPPWALKLGTQAIAEGVKKGKTPPEHPFFAALDPVLHLAGGFSKLRLRLQREFIDYLQSELLERKIRKGLVSYDDLLSRLDRALGGPEGQRLARSLRKRYGAVLVDEFQDTDARQYRILRSVFGGPGHPLFLIGDPKQAIYGFRGADVHSYFRAADDAAERRFTLGTNWRSDPKLISAVNALFSQHPKPFVMEAIAFEEVAPRPEAIPGLVEESERPALRFLLIRDEGSSQGGRMTKGEEEPLIARRSAAWVRDLLGSETRIGDGDEKRPLLPRDFALLCRTNAQGRLIQEKLRDLGIPSVLDGDSSVFDAKEAEGLERILLAMAEPSDARLVRAALATELLGVDAHGLQRAMEDDAIWEEWMERFHLWHETWKRRGVSAVFPLVLQDCQLPSRLLAQIGGERALANYRQLVEILQGVEQKERFGPLLLVEWLGRMRRDEGLRAGFASEASQLRLESDEDAVAITTIHRSKGLEFPIVLCPFLHGKSGLFTTEKKHPRFHDPSAEQRLSLDLGSEELPAHVALAEMEALAEGLRLLYVALTRARHLCAVVWGRLRESHESALGYLLHTAKLPDRGDRKEISSAIKKLGLSEIENDLRLLAENSHFALGVEELPESEAPEALPQEVAAPALGEGEFDRELDQSYRTASYSALIRSSSPRSESAFDVRGDELEVKGPTIETPPDFSSGWDDLPPGASSGLAVHAILEDMDFRTEAEDPRLAALVDRHLQRRGIDGTDAATLVPALCDSLDTPLRGPMEDEFRLRTLSTADRGVELEFLFPLCESDREALFTAERLAEIFQRHHLPCAGSTYPERIRDLGFRVRGFLRGFIDLVFRQGGRWYLIDWKTNRLGASASDYGPTHLRQAMEEHHYDLQAAIYAVALRRHLRRWMAPEEASRRFGGAAYLFLRGMRPGQPGSGVCWPAFPREFLDDLDAALDGSQRSEV